MNSLQPKEVPLSVARNLVLLTHQVCDYVQGTMGLEYQGLNKDSFRKFQHDSFKYFKDEYLKQHTMADCHCVYCRYVSNLSVKKK